MHMRIRKRRSELFCEVIVFNRIKVNTVLRKKKRREMDRIFDKHTLEKMNTDPKYGRNWIRNLNNMNSQEDIKIYATGNASIGTGKEYIALPANKKLTQEERIRYNITN